MSFPNYPQKYRARSFVTAKDFWRYKKEIGRVPKEKPPKGVIICYSPSLMSHIINNHPIIKVEEVFGDYFYLLEEFNKQIGICGGFGIGAPIVAILIEELSVFGVTNFLSIGVAGALQKTLRLGSYVVCDKAIRDEGTSHHYCKPDKYSYPSKKVTNKMIETLQELNLEYTRGTSWTVDAPYRETYEEIEKYKKEGVLTVEMEAAAIFAVAKYLNVEAGSLFTISDYLCEDEWQLHFHLTEEHLKTLFLIAKKTINSL
ncbi:MAG: purine phosphorylase [Promethearchaeota archaeon]|nr:MAG: purine phosphorylase [Candidatus Lokiarchaeota archaeon]